MHVGQCLDENYISGFCVLSGLKKLFFILSCVCVVLCCVAFSLGCLLIGFVLFTSFIVLICCWFLQQFY